MSCAVRAAVVPTEPPVLTLLDLLLLLGAALGSGSLGWGVLAPKVAEDLLQLLEEAPVGKFTPGLLQQPLLDSTSRQIGHLPSPAYRPPGLLHHLPQLLHDRPGEA